MRIGRFGFRLTKQLSPAILSVAMLLTPVGGWAAKGPDGISAEHYPQSAQSPDSTKVVSVDGGPLAGVVLSIQPRPVVLLPENISATTVTVSDANGTIATPPAEVPGVYFLLQKPDFQTLALDASRPLPHQVVMRPGRTISGTVFSSDGQPISGAVVGPVQPVRSGRDSHTQRYFPRVAVRTGVDGTFTIPGMPVSAVQVQFSSTGFAPRMVTFEPSANEHKVALSTGGAITKGLVVGSKDRAPQPAIAVEASSQGMTVYGTTDESGTYIIDNLPTGTWALRPAGGGPLSGTQSRAKTVEIGTANQTLNVPLVLNQGVILAGRAIDAETSRGLAGINITLAGYAGRGARAVLTEADGTFIFENLDSMQDVIIRFDPIKFVYLLPNGAYRDYFDISKVSDTNFDVTTLTLPLHRRLPVQGSVVDSAGKPVPDVEVHMQALDVVNSAPTKSGRNLLDFTAKSNGEGKFVAGVYPPGQYKIWAQQETLVSQVEQADIFTTSPAPNPTLRLTNAAELSGIVTNAHDDPVTAAEVIAWPANAPEPEENPIPGRETYAYAKSMKEGKFTLTGLRGEPMTLRASHPDYLQPIKLDYDPATGAVAAQTSPGIVLKFPSGGEFSIQVLNDEGQPLSQAEVGLDFREGLEGHRASVMTDRYGHAFAGAIPAKQLAKFTINHPMYAAYESDGAVALPATNLKITLKKRAGLIANITGKPLIAGVAPDVYLLRATVASADANTPPKSGFEQVNQTSVVAGRAVFQSLPEGWYKVAFADSGTYAESDAVKIVAGGEDQTVELALPEGNHLVGVVVDKQTGDPIAGANVTLHPDIDSPLVAERATQNTSSLPDGTFELFNAGSGQIRVKAIATGYPDYEKTVTIKPSDTLTIEMSNQPATLSGKVTAGNAPVEGALLILAQNNPQHTPVATATTDASGLYHLDGFSVGSFLLSVEAPIGEGDNISRKNVDIEIEDEGATQDVEFAALVAVQGTVKLDGKAPSRDSGEPVTLLFMSATFGGESKMVQTDADGKYSTQLEPGEYTVSLEDQGGRPVTVIEGESQTLDLSF